MSFDSVIHALAYIIDTEGEDILSDGRRVLAMLRDLVPKEQEDIMLMKHVFDNGLGRVLPGASDDAGRRLAMNDIFHSLTVKVRLSDDAANDACVILINALGWRIPAPKDKPEPAPKQTPPPPKPSQPKPAASGVKPLTKSNLRTPPEGLVTALKISIALLVVLLIGTVVEYIVFFKAFQSAYGALVKTSIAGMLLGLALFWFDLKMSDKTSLFFNELQTRFEICFTLSLFGAAGGNVLLMILSFIRSAVSAVFS
ncbi:MAG: hypothetical protein IJ555_08260 [Ruminococcus sp.]|nr:hypothetical protein [Ruminococcus sp.]